MGHLWRCSLEWLALWFRISVAKCQVSRVKNQSFRVWPKDVGIWIVIPSECCQFPLSVVSEERKQGRYFWLGSILCSSLPCSSLVCHLLWQKSMGRQRRGKSLEPVFAFPTFPAVAPPSQCSHHWNMLETCLKNAIVIIFHLFLRVGFIGAKKQTHDP